MICRASSATLRSRTDLCGPCQTPLSFRQCRLCRLLATVASTGASLASNSRNFTTRLHEIQIQIRKVSLSFTWILTSMTPSTIPWRRQRHKIFAGCCLLMSYFIVPYYRGHALRRDCSVGMAECPKMEVWDRLSPGGAVAVDDFFHHAQA